MRRCSSRGRKIVGLHRMNKEVEREKEGVRHRVEADGCAEQHHDGADLQEAPWNFRPGPYHDARQPDTGHDLDGDKPHEVRAEPVAALSALQCQATTGTCREEARPSHEQRAAPAMGTAEPHGSPEEGSRAGLHSSDSIQVVRSTSLSSYPISAKRACQASYSTRRTRAAAGPRGEPTAAHRSDHAIGRAVLDQQRDATECARDVHRCDGAEHLRCKAGRARSGGKAGRRGRRGTTSGSLARP